jgi:hypothetical protein
MRIEKIKKTCSCCNEEKYLHEFSYKGRQCKPCINKKTNLRRKNFTPEQLEKKRKQEREAYWRRREKKLKEMSNYSKRNREKINKRIQNRKDQNPEIRKKWQEYNKLLSRKQHKELSDRYIKKLLREKNIQGEISEELIKAKRLIIKINREAKSQINEQNQHLQAIN